MDVPLPTTSILSTPNQRDKIDFERIDCTKRQKLLVENMALKDEIASLKQQNGILASALLQSVTKQIL